MKIRIINLKLNNTTTIAYITCTFLLFLFLFLGVPISTHSVFAGNVSNKTVISQVNVSNTEPTFYSVVISSPLDTFSNIDLGAGNATTVICNGSFQDINGYDTMSAVNATFYDSTVASNSADDNNTHYTNSSCETLTDCQVIPGSNNRNGSCLCQFAVMYYANPTGWICNMTITDSGGMEKSRNSTNTTINEILGIDVESNEMDFGNISVTQVSETVRENVTNIGNIPTNITVRNYGGDNESLGQNVSMICDPAVSGSNITFDNMRFDVNNASQNVFGDMINVTNQTKLVENLTLPKRVSSTSNGNSSNSTFWRLQIPLGTAGICNGTIIFGAINAN